MQWLLKSIHKRDHDDEDEDGNKLTTVANRRGRVIKGMLFPCVLILSLRMRREKQVASANVTHTVNVRKTEVLADLSNGMNARGNPFYMSRSHHDASPVASAGWGLGVIGHVQPSARNRVDLSHQALSSDGLDRMPISRCDRASGGPGQVRVRSCDIRAYTGYSVCT
jgi:hypothetical protein